MYEHPVFCLASQVMDLTIREYLPPQPQLICFLIITVSMHVNHQKQPQMLSSLSSFWSVTLIVILCSKPLFITKTLSILSVIYFAVLPETTISVCLQFECIFTLLMCKLSKISF